VLDGREPAFQFVDASFQGFDALGVRHGCDHACDLRRRRVAFLWHRGAVMPYADRQQYREYQDAYHGDPINREKARERSRVSYASNRKAWNDRAKKYRAANKAKVQEAHQRWLAAHPEQKLLSRTKSRARRSGLAFDLTIGDIKIPAICPALGIPIICHGGPIDNAPSVDRIDNSKGYSRGNVIVVSWRANRLKADGSLEEIVRLAAFYSKLAGERP
jgi:hypothetical protein